MKQWYCFDYASPFNEPRGFTSTSCRLNLKSASMSLNSENHDVVLPLVLSAVNPFKMEGRRLQFTFLTVHFITRWPTVNIPHSQAVNHITMAVPRMDDGTKWFVFGKRKPFSISLTVQLTNEIPVASEYNRTSLIWTSVIKSDLSSVPWQLTWITSSQILLLLSSNPRQLYSRQTWHSTSYEKTDRREVRKPVS